MTDRYFVPEIPVEGGPLALPDEEAAHASRVMRVQIGQPLVVFDGQDHEAVGHVVSVDRKHVFVALEPRQRISRELPNSTHVIVSLPKGDRAKVLVEKLTEMGVHRITPLVCARTQGAPSTSALDKLRRAVIESCKQCGRNRLLVMDSAIKWSDFFRLADLPENQRLASLDLIAHPDGHSVQATVASQDHDAVRILIGPEGGFTDAEVAEAVDHGWQRVSLGPRILRIETSAVALVARVVIA